MGRRIFAAVLTASVGALGALACVGDPEIGGSSLDSGADAGGTDAGATDAGATDVSTVDANKESLDGSLFDNGDFELGCALGWRGEDGTLTDESAGRTGKGCRVCGNGGQQYFYIGQALDRVLVPDTTYVARAWVRATLNKPSHKVEVVMNTTDSNDVDVDYADVNAIPIGPEFTKIEAALEIKSPGGVRLSVRFGPDYYEGESCFVIDDAALIPMSP